MATVPAKRILSRHSIEIPAEISRELQHSAVVVESEDCPWVDIAGVFVSVTMTGETSWGPVVAKLGGRRAYTVFTGRHGDIPNLLDDDSTTIGVFDPEHTAEDTAIAERMRREFPNIDLRLIDAGTFRKNQAGSLRAATRTEKSSGRVVIYSWCYGLFTFCEMFAAENEFFRERQQSFLIRQPVDALTGQYWYWL